MIVIEAYILQTQNKRLMIFIDIIVALTYMKNNSIKIHKMIIEKIVQKYPINLRHTIFKEIMHYEILESLFSLQEIQNTLVFQGGTALRLCYNNDRYSEDKD